MYEVDYFYLTDLASKVLGSTTKLRPLVLSKASPFYVEKIDRLHRSAQTLHGFFSSYRIDSTKTLNQVRAHFNAILINLRHLENSDSFNGIRTRSLIKKINNNVSDLKDAFERFGIADR